MSRKQQLQQQQQQQKVLAEQLAINKQTQFWIRSLDRNDKEIAAVIELNQQLHQLRSYIEQYIGIWILLDLGDGTIRLSPDGQDILVHVINNNNNINVDNEKDKTTKKKKNNNNNEKDNNNTNKTSNVIKSLEPLSESVMKYEDQEVCIDFLLRKKLRRRLLSRICRRLNRIAASMDGVNGSVEPPAAPKYGDLRMNIDNVDNKELQELYQKRQQQQQLLLQYNNQKFEYYERKEFIMQNNDNNDNNTKVVVKSEEESKEKDDSNNNDNDISSSHNNNKEDNNGNSSSSNDNNNQENVDNDEIMPQAPSSSPVKKEQDEKVENEEEDIIIDYEIFKEYNDTYEKIMDTVDADHPQFTTVLAKIDTKLKNNNKNKDGEKDSSSKEHDYNNDTIEEEYKIPGIRVGAIANPNMSLKEKELEYKRWQTTLLARIPQQPTYTDLNLENRIFYNKERRKLAMEAKKKKLIELEQEEMFLQQNELSSIGDDNDEKEEDIEVEEEEEQNKEEEITTDKDEITTNDRNDENDVEKDNNKYNDDDDAMDIDNNDNVDKKEDKVSDDIIEQKRENTNNDIDDDEKKMELLKETEKKVTEENSIKSVCGNDDSVEQDRPTTIEEKKSDIKVDKEEEEEKVKASVKANDKKDTVSKPDEVIVNTTVESNTEQKPEQNVDVDSTKQDKTTIVDTDVVMVDKESKTIVEDKQIAMEPLQKSGTEKNSDDNPTKSLAKDEHETKDVEMTAAESASKEKEKDSVTKESQQPGGDSSIIGESAQDNDKQKESDGEAKHDELVNEKKIDDEEGKQIEENVSKQGEMKGDMKESGRTKDKSSSDEPKDGSGKTDIAITKESSDGKPNTEGQSSDTKEKVYDKNYLQKGTPKDADFKYTSDEDVETNVASKDTQVNKDKKTDNEEANKMSINEDIAKSGEAEMKDSTANETKSTDNDKDRKEEKHLSDSDWVLVEKDDVTEKMESVEEDIKRKDDSVDAQTKKEADDDDSKQRGYDESEMKKKSDDDAKRDDDAEMKEEINDDSKKHDDDDAEMKKEEDDNSKKLEDDDAEMKKEEDDDSKKRDNDSSEMEKDDDKQLNEDDAQMEKKADDDSKKSDDDDDDAEMKKEADDDSKKCDDVEEGVEESNVSESEIKDVKMKDDDSSEEEDDDDKEDGEESEAESDDDDDVKISKSGDSKEKDDDSSSDSSDSDGEKDSNSDDDNDDDNDSKKDDKDDLEKKDDAALPKIVRPISLAAIPSFHEQDQRRVKFVQGDLMIASIQEHSHRRLLENIHDYNKALRSIAQYQARRNQIQTQLNALVYEQQNLEHQLNTEYASQFAIAEKRWNANRMRFEHNKLNQVLPSRHGRIPRGTPFTHAYMARPDRSGISEQVGDCMADVIDAVEATTRGIFPDRRFTEPFVPPRLPPGADPQKLQRLKTAEAQQRNELNALAIRVSDSEEARKRAWKKIMKTKADCEMPHQYTSSNGTVRLVQINASNYQSFPPPPLQFSKLLERPKNPRSKAADFPMFNPKKRSLPVVASTSFDGPKYCPRRVRRRVLAALQQRATFVNSSTVASSSSVAEEEED